MLQPDKDGKFLKDPLEVEALHQAVISQLKDMTKHEDLDLGSLVRSHKSEDTFGDITKLARNLSAMLWYQKSGGMTDGLSILLNTEVSAYSTCTSSDGFGIKVHCKFMGIELEIKNYLYWLPVVSFF